MSTAHSGPSANGHGRRFASERFARRPPAAYLESELLGQAVARAKAGDSDALRFLHARFADDVCRYVAGIVGDAHEAEDVTRVLFVNLRTEIQRYEQRHAPFSAWILRVARTDALGHVRARGDLPFEVPTSDGGRTDEDLERSQALRLALDRLPLEQLEVLVLRHVAGLTPVEIAERLGKTESSIHALHHRARDALHAALRELDAGPLTASA